MTIKLLTAFIIIFSFLAISCYRQEKKEVQPKKSVSNDPLDRKIDSLTLLIKKNNKNDALYYQRARLYKKQRKPLLAIHDMQSAVAIDSSIYDYFHFLGDLYFEVSNSGGALYAYKKSVELNPYDEDALLRLGEIYYSLKDRPNSFRYLNEALSQNKYNPRIYFYKAYNYLEEGDTTRGIANLKACVEVDPEYYNAYMQLGLVLSKKKDARAPDYYANALRIHPGSLEARYGRAMFYQEKKDFEKAKKDYYSILALKPDHKSANYNMGFIYYLKENYDSSVFYFTQAINSRQDYVDAWYGRGLSYMKLNRNKMAVSDFENVLRLKPDDKDALEKLSQLRK